MPEELNSEFESAYARPGATHYMDAPALRRGLHTPARIKLLIAALGAVALLITSLFGFGLYRNIANAPAKYAQSIDNAIHSGPGLELPTLSSFVGMDNDGIRNAISENGYKIIDVDAEYTEEEDIDEHSIDLMKVPGDVEYNKSVEMFKQSLRRTQSADAAHFLSNSWRFTSYSANGVDLKVKYVDFDSTSLEDAIADAIAAQGWTDTTFGDSGVDQSGNTFQSGSVVIDETTYRWTVSVCPLDEVYDISGFPENASYVGARLVQ